jgi:putative tricarboxylic transport membrane protein
MNKTLIVNDVVWMLLAFLVCLGGLKLGFGTFSDPGAGFLPLISGVILGLLALIDLGSGLIGKWKLGFEEKNYFTGIDWKKLIVTLAVLFGYVIFFEILGFIIATIIALFFLFEMFEPIPWWEALIMSVITSGLSYLLFKIGLDCQLAEGILAFL